MYQHLRPELRGAHRVLRSIRHQPSPYTHRVVRSFASYTRLQEQPPSGNTNSGQPSRGVPLLQSLTRRIDELLNAREDALNARAEARSSAAINVQDEVKREQQKRKGIHDAIARGEVPPGYKLIKDIAKDDIPGSLFDSDAPIAAPIPDELPFLCAEDKSYDPLFIPLPRGFQGIQQSTREQKLNPAETKTQDDGTSDNVADLERGADRRYHGSRQNRRRRARASVAATQKPDPEIASWFMQNVVKDFESVQSGTNSGPGVVAVRQLPDGTYVPVTASLDQAQAQLPAEENTAETKTEPLVQAYGTGGDGSGAGIGGGSTPSSSSSGTESGQHSKNHTSLSDGRYFIEDAQYQELLNTFKGRLQQATHSSPSDRRSPLVMNHLTVLHGAKDADLLLDTLILDLCKTVGANRVRLDIQDISELITSADVDPEIAEKGGRLSFKVYKDIFGPSNVYQDSIFPREEEEEDEDGEEDDSHGPRGSVDIPIGSVVSFSGGGMPKNMFGDLRRQLSSAGPALSRFLDNQSMGGNTRISAGIFENLIESILSASTQAQSSKPSSTNDNTTEEQQPQNIAPQRPIVIQIPNYRALQNHNLAEVFMGELLTLADRRARQQNQRIVVVGTDCMRNFGNSNNPRAILEEQEDRSYGASTAIVLTPVFPDRDAELALLRDREKKIRDVNVRHLYLVLKSRGVLLKGLEDGFWHRDYTPELGETDCKALSETYWPYIRVQRIAAMIAGNDTSQTPIADAVNTLSQSDESKVAWARRTQPDVAKEELKEAEKPDNKRLRQIRSKATRHEKKLLSGVVEPKKIATTFNDIHIPAETVEALQTLTTLSLVRPEAFKYGVLKSDRIPGLLLYGPPGTGKTLAAKAVARESGATMLEVSAADLNDMYVGEGEKNVQALFSLAKKLSPCVVFLDEADAMFSARSAQGRRVSHRELLNQFLKEWDGMSNDSGSAFIMVATNRPMDLDDAVLRRLPRRLLVDLPTEADRLEILKIHLRQEALSDDVNLADLATRTPFYSGSDLKNVAVAAALNAVREESEAAKQHRLTNPDSEVQYGYPEKRILTAKHFDKALEEISASISEDMSSLREIKKFDEQYGDRKGRKRKAKGWGFKSPKEVEEAGKNDTVKVRS